MTVVLLEQCQPGYSLHSEPEHKQDEVIATLLRRLWKRSASANDLQQFRHLSKMLEFWRDETLGQAHRWPDPGLVREGLRLWEVLGNPLPTDVLLATDLHAAIVFTIRARALADDRLEATHCDTGLGQTSGKPECCARGCSGVYRLMPAGEQPKAGRT